MRGDDVRPSSSHGDAPRERAGSRRRGIPRAHVHTSDDPVVLPAGDRMRYDGTGDPARPGGLVQRPLAPQARPREGTSDAHSKPRTRPSGLLVLLLAFAGFGSTALAAPAGRRQAGQPAGQGDQPLPAPARPQPGRLVSLGPRGVRQGEGREQADLPVGRLQLVLLVPRHGARELRGRRDRQGSSTRISSASRSTARSGPTSTRST